MEHIRIRTDANWDFEYKCLQTLRPFKRHIDQVVVLHQSLMVEERYCCIFHIPEHISVVNFQRNGAGRMCCRKTPANKDDLAGVKKIWWEELKRKVGLDQARRGHWVQLGDLTLRLKSTVLRDCPNNFDVIFVPERPGGILQNSIEINQVFYTVQGSRYFGTLNKLPKC